MAKQHQNMKNVYANYTVCTKPEENPNIFVIFLKKAIDKRENICYNVDAERKEE